MRIRLRLSRRRSDKARDAARMVILAGCACFLVYCVSRLFLYVLDAQRAARNQERFQELYFTETEKRAEQQDLAQRSSIVKQFTVIFPQSEISGETPVQTAAPKTADWPGNPTMTVSAALKKLRQKNADIIGWLSIPGMLDQAVVQKNNAYYLNRDYQGYHNANGALFLEEGISLKTLPDTYIIFGHNMKTGDMFGSLRLYEDTGYYRKHALIDFNVLYEDGRYVIFSIADVDILQGMRRYVPFMQLPGMEAEQRMDCIRKLQAYSKWYSPIAVGAEDQLLLLVTCEGTEETRRVVAARRLREGESAEAVQASLVNVRSRNQ